MVEIIWTSRSLTDLQEIGEYISRDSFHYAGLTLERIMEAAVYLKKNPMIGRKVPEINDAYIREIIIGSYRLIYSLERHAQVHILTVHHSSRLLKKSKIKRSK